MGLCVGYTALLFVLARVAGPLFVRLFTQDPELAQEAFDAIKVCTLAIIPWECSTSWWTALRVSARVPVFPAPVLLAEAGVLCGHLRFAHGFWGRAAFYAEPLSDILGPAVTIVVYFLAMGKILGSGP